VCEASARALDAPGPAALRAVVEKRVAEVVAEGQLDESELSLGDLGAVSGVLCRGLEEVYQARTAAEPPSAELRQPVQLVRP
jgi:membrane-associated HD superfamily phosphohydrolase